jgi:hypothetical protein
VLTRHQDKRGNSKIVRHVSLPLTAPRCIMRVITDIATIDITSDGLVLRAVLPGWTPEEIQASPTLPSSSPMTSRSSRSRTFPEVCDRTSREELLKEMRTFVHAWLADPQAVTALDAVSSRASA